ncbi:hypothetical protein [Candidatus Albibeggiatoa sp. nov. BB20]|uniref:hypothetical protein n=1 Tax=Candidatus Albibeggiatoa sp. nov. BB20 TaxID=3162723 RepID=UPI0033659FF7
MTRTIAVLFIIIALHAQQLVVYVGLASCEHLQTQIEQPACHQTQTNPQQQDNFCQHCFNCELCQVVSFNFSSDFTKTLSIALSHTLNSFNPAHFYQFFPQTLLRPPQKF